MNRAHLHAFTRELEKLSNQASRRETGKEHAKRFAGNVLRGGALNALAGGAVVGGVTGSRRAAIRSALESGLFGAGLGGALSLKRKHVKVSMALPRTPAPRFKSMIRKASFPKPKKMQPMKANTALSTIK